MTQSEKRNKRKCWTEMQKKLKVFLNGEKKKKNNLKKTLKSVRLAMKGENKNVSSKREKLGTRL